MLQMACSAGGEPESFDTSSQALASRGECAPGSLQEPDTGECSSAVDRRKEFAAESGQKGRTPRNLRALREERTARATAKKAAGGEAPLPEEIPGGLGAGVAFNSGALQAHDSATLYTHMVVYPEGFGFDLPAELFTTSTNRTQKGVEVVGWYQSAGIHHIGVFDWSCSAEAPCEGGQTTPSWIWTRPLDSEPCHLTEGPDGDGYTKDSLYYANSTYQSGGTWHNDVSFWNYCSSTWDLVYSHAYGGTQEDCSVTGCGWWGPIVENFFDLDAGYPIPELGFFDTSLVHNGVTSTLSPAETWFSGPPSTWNLCYREENHSWGTTPLACPSTSSLSTNVRYTANWSGGYCAEVDVVNGGSTPVSTWAARLDLNDSSMQNTWGGTFVAQSGNEYDVTPLFWNASIAAGAQATFGFCAQKTGVNWTPTATAQ
jgi:hypothetical protein